MTVKSSKKRATVTAERSSIFRPLSSSSLFTALRSNDEDTSTSSFSIPPSNSINPSQNQQLSPTCHNGSNLLTRAVELAYDHDPLALLPTSNLGDLGDDDSFAPDIVSGCNFNNPEQYQFYSEQISFNENQNEQEHEKQNHIIETDLGEDGEYTNDSIETFLPVESSLMNEYGESYIDDIPNQTTIDYDHRNDAIYDDLDDIGDWVANTTPNQDNDLTKRFEKAIHSNLNNFNQSTSIANAALSTHQRSEDRRRENQARDKIDRATVEQVLDPRTRMILFRLLSRSRLRTLDGCVSTGKEANVYYATAAADPNCVPDKNGMYSPIAGLVAHDSSPDAGVAVKVFKTSILQFKDRERYVAGEFRFRRGGYQRGSNRKMVQQWAEKEFRNQKRLQDADIPAPIPLLLKPPVLIMSFFGKDGWPAPRLKDAKLSQNRMARLYIRVCMLMRRMFRVAHLVHGDLSEYNMLYHNGDVIIIDVSQSIEDDHPSALDFLRRDCANVNDYFRRSAGIPVLSVRELFDFVTGEHIGDSAEKQEMGLNMLLDAAKARDIESMRVSQRDDEVFMKSYIPRTLQDVEPKEFEYTSQTNDDIDSKLYAKMTGLTLTQKRERASSANDTSSSFDLSQEKNDDSSSYGIVRLADEEIPEGGDPQPSANLAMQVIEPATSRLVRPGENRKSDFLSPCTSNSSSKPTGDELEQRRYAKFAGVWDLENAQRSDSAGLQDLSHLMEQNMTDADTLNENIDSDNSSAEWHSRPDTGISDPYMGLSKKEWKKKVKAEARERRQNKVPKHVKKRKELLAKRHKGAK